MGDNKSAAEVVDMKLEIEKCKNDPYYFFTKYVTVDGKPATTVLSKEVFNDFFNNYSRLTGIKARRSR
jgi:hypothetical protein